jgi:hypothetical protein
MGWENCHLHLFRFGKKEYGIHDSEYPSEMRDERGRRLREFLRDEGEMFGYQYDFGDNWEHDVVVERIVTGAEVTDARCLEGERACPPEDVGSPSGYMEYLAALKDPSHPDHLSRRRRGRACPRIRRRCDRIGRRLGRPHGRNP